MKKLWVSQIMCPLLQGSLLFPSTPAASLPSKSCDGTRPVCEAHLSCGYHFLLALVYNSGVRSNVSSVHERILTAALNCARSHTNHMNLASIPKQLCCILPLMAPWLNGFVMDHPWKEKH
uniref:Secreted protein n=1 Tax=Opuntia streptacantha TaxID=393608 RepID=A0A7C8Z011_OPUST